MPHSTNIDRELLEGILAIGEGAPGSEIKVQMLLQYRARGERLGPVDPKLVGRIAELDGGLTEAQHLQGEFRRMMEELLEPPWYPAIVSQVFPDAGGPRRMLVYQGGTARVVGVAGNVDADALAPGDEIYLGKEQNFIVGRSPEGIPPCGETGIFDRWTADGRLVIKTRDEEIVVKAASSLLTGHELRSGDQVRFDRTVWFAFERVDRSHGTHLFLDETPQETFEDIGGLSPEIERMQRAMLLRLRHGAVAARYGVRVPRSILLVGPPGVGKTMMARALCQWLSTQTASGRSRFINVKPGSLHSKWYAESENNYRELFRVAREAGAANPDIPVCVFIDEVDSIGLARGQSGSHIDDRVQAALLAELDGLEARGNILVIAATNRREACEPALLRPGRLGDLIIEVRRPDMAAARSIFGKYLGAELPYAEAALSGEAARRAVIDVVVSQLYAPNGDNELATLVFRDGTRKAVQAPDMISGATIAAIAQQARERACHREIETGEEGIRSTDLVAAAVEQCTLAAAVLNPNNCRQYLSGLRDDEDVVSVSQKDRKISYPQIYLRAA